MRWVMIGLAVASLALNVSRGEAIAQQFGTGPYPDEQTYIDERFANTTYVKASKSIGLIRAVELRISDQVEGGCWTNHEAIKARFRVELERSNIAVYDEPLAMPSAFTPVVSLTAVGFRMGNGVCAATATAEVGYRGDVQLGSLAHTGGIMSIGGIHILWSNTTIVSKGGNLNEPLMQQSQQWIDTLIADISEAKRDMDVQKASAMWPKREPMTDRDFQAQIDKVMKRSN